MNTTTTTFASRFTLLAALVGAAVMASSPAQAGLLGGGGGVGGGLGGNIGGSLNGTLNRPALPMPDGSRLRDGASALKDRTQGAAAQAGERAAAAKDKAQGTLAGATPPKTGSGDTPATETPKPAGGSLTLGGQASASRDGAALSGSAAASSPR